MHPQGRKPMGPSRGGQGNLDQLQIVRGLRLGGPQIGAEAVFVPAIMTDGVMAAFDFGGRAVLAMMLMMHARVRRITQGCHAMVSHTATMGAASLQIQTFFRRRMAASRFIDCRSPAFNLVQLQTPRNFQGRLVGIIREHGNPISRPWHFRGPRCSASSRWR